MFTRVDYTYIHIGEGHRRTQAEDPRRRAQADPAEDPGERRRRTQADPRRTQGGPAGGPAFPHANPPIKGTGGPKADPGGPQADPRRTCVSTHKSEADQSHPVWGYIILIANGDGRTRACRLVGSPYTSRPQQHSLVYSIVCKLLPQMG